MTEPTNPPPELELTERPDPAFKEVTGLRAEVVGLRLGSAELPQSLTADMVLEIPPGVKLEGTLFAFLEGYDYVVMDFKSENDPLDLPKLAMNVARTALFYTRHTGTPPARILNLIVSSRYPQEVLKQVGAGLANTSDRPWLWLGGPTYQPLAIVVCRDLPLQPAYSEWLTFFPSDNKDWPKVIAELLRLGRRDLVNIMRKMRAKEFKAMQIDVISKYPPEEQARMRRELLELIDSDLEILKAESPEVYERWVDEKMFDNLITKLTSNQLNKLEENLTIEQLKTMLQHKEAKEQNN